jgi:PKD repeat protein
MQTKILFAIGALAASAAAQFSVTVPPGYASNVGNSNNVFPWGRAASSMRFQQVYDSTNWTNQGVNFPILITGMKFRPYPGATGTWAGGAWSALRVDFATCPNDYLTPSATFASNLGPDVATVFNGALTIPGGSVLGAGVVNPPHVDVALPAPFLYDPAGGDFVFDVHVDGTTWTGGAVRGCDVVSGLTGAQGPALGSRIYSTAGLAATTGTIGLNHSLICDFTYTPAAGLYPGFNASTTSAALNTPVNFTDTTYSSDPLGVIAWAWDVDGDSVVDYTTQNCSHSYPTEGRYDVTLTVVDATHGTRTLTRTQYIGVDLVAADFTVQQLPNRLVIFSDTSAGNPATWAWDVDGDNVVDYTGQNAAHVYPAAGAYNVTLTVTDAISTSSKTVHLGIDIIPVPGFGSTFASTAATRGFWFQAPVKFSIVSALVPNEANETLQNAAIYRLTAPPPTFSATATGGFEWAGIGQPANTPMACAVSFDVGEYVGVLGACGSTTMRNSYGTPAGPFATSVLGVPTTLTRMGTQFNLFSNPPETLPYFQEPTGALSRVVLGVTAAAGIPYGTGTPSGAGPAAPRMRCTALPFVGGTTTLAVEQGDSNVLGFMVGGFGRTSIPTPFGEVLVANQVLTQLITPGIGGPGTFTFSWNVPNLPTLIGFDVNFQYAQLLTTTNQVALSNGVELSFAQ